MANVTFTINFHDKQIILSGLTPKPIQQSIIHVDGGSNNHYHLEYKLDPYVKWVFIWTECCKEQFFKVKQFYEFPSTRITPIGYKPWSTLASWSYIAKPSIGTMQKNNIYRNCYYSAYMPEINSIVCNTVGSEYGDWDTTNTENGYWC